MTSFKSREEAGHSLARQIADWEAHHPTIVAVPRGGLPVAAPVARAFKRPFHLLPMRRLEVPWDPKNVFGYVTVNGTLHLNQPLIGQVRLTPPEIQKIAHRERLNLRQHLVAWGAPPFPSLEGESVLLIDDGMHSGWTLFSALEMVKNLGARETRVAVPVTTFRAHRFIQNHCDEIVCLHIEELPRYEIQNYYEDFTPVSDEQIRALLKTIPPNPKQTAA
ncbi:MAG: phosphoribosyltransferase family protein [Terriglobia bacterium]